MSPNLEKTILEALRAGKSIREVAAEASTSPTTVHRVAKANGIVNGAKPKRAMPERNGTRNTERGTEQGDVPADAPPAPDERPTIQLRLEHNTKLMTRAVNTALRLLERAEAILADPENKNKANLQKAAANMAERASLIIERSNLGQRLNAGLATGKTESDVRGHVRYTPDDAHDVLKRELGLGHVKVTGDTEAVSN
jgi:hypothetical protein